MPDNLSQDFQRSIGYKHALGTVSSDVDKSSVEETKFTAGYLTGEEVLVTPIPYNDPASAIISGVVSSGTLVMTQDITVGGAFRAYDCPQMPIIHPAKHGNLYAPLFYHSSGTLIDAGDLFTYSVFYYDAGKLVIERNTTTDQWAEPFLIEAFFYIGKTLEQSILDGSIGAGGSGVTSLSALTDVTLTSPVSGEVLAYNGIRWVNGTAIGEVTNSQLVQTSGDIINYVDAADANLQQQIDNFQSSSGGVSPALLLQASGDITDLAKRYAFFISG